LIKRVTGATDLDIEVVQDLLSSANGRKVLEGADPPGRETPVEGLDDIVIGLDKDDAFNDCHFTGKAIIAECKRTDPD
jgi:hypothetical protein